MSIEKMREEFEAWMRNKAKIIVGSSDPYPARLERAYWSVWQASRESLVIELPPSSDTHDQFWKDDVIESIEAAGLKVNS